MLEAAREVGIRYLLAGLKERVAEQWLGHQPLFCALDFSPGSAARWILWDLLSQHKPHLTFSLSCPLFLLYGLSTRHGASPVPVGCKSACNEMPHYSLVGFHSPCSACCPLSHPGLRSAALVKQSRSCQGNGCCCAHECVANNAKGCAGPNYTRLGVVARLRFAGHVACISQSWGCLGLCRSACCPGWSCFQSRQVCSRISHPL